MSNIIRKITRDNKSQEEKESKKKEIKGESERDEGECAYTYTNMHLSLPQLHTHRDRVDLDTLSALTRQIELLYLGVLAADDGCNLGDVGKLASSPVLHGLLEIAQANQALEH